MVITSEPGEAVVATVPAEVSIPVPGSIEKTEILFESMFAAFTEERDIFRRFPESTLIGSDFAGIIGHSASLSFEKVDMLRERITDLRNICSAHPGNSRIVEQIKKSLEMLRVVGMGTYMVDGGNDAVHKAISSEIRNLFEILDKHAESSSPA